jgi:hypothetical protein
VHDTTTDPDKNACCTPLFLAIQSAHERLTNMVDREEEEEKQKQASAAAAEQAKKSRPPPSSKQQSTPGPSSSDSQNQQNSKDRGDNQNKRAKAKAERWKQQQEAEEAAAAAARQKAEEEEEEAQRKEAEAWIFPVPSHLQVVCINATTVHLQWSPPPPCAYTRSPSYLRTELGWRIQATPSEETEDGNNQTSDETETENKKEKDKDKDKDKEKPTEPEPEWTLSTIMRDQAELTKDHLPAGEDVEFSLRFYIQPTAETQGGHRQTPSIF